VSVLGRRVKSPTEDDYRKFERVVKYIRGSKGQGLRIKLGKGEMKLVAFVDASYGVHPDRKSHTGCAIFLGECGPVWCKSTRQVLTTKSASEAECVGAVDMSGAYLWIRYYLLGQGYQFRDSKVYLKTDNEAVLAWVKNGKPMDMNSRHIDMKYFMLTDRIKRGEVDLSHCPTEHMIADYLTKPLEGAKEMQFSNVLAGISPWKM
jgi:hypothetical protein